MSETLIYSLSEYDQAVNAIGKENLESVLGIKGTALSELLKNEFPVPNGFIITSAAVKDYFGDTLMPKNDDNTNETPEEGNTEEEENQTPDSPLSVPQDESAQLDISPSLWNQILENVKKLEESQGGKFGGSENPLFLCVRPSPTTQMSHILSSVFAIGYTQETTQALAAKSSEPKEVWNVFQEMVKNYGVSTANISAEKFDEIVNNVKGEKDELDPEDYPTICDNFKELINEESGTPYPEDPLTDLKIAIKNVFDSWNSAKAKEFCQENSIDHSSTYPAVIVQISILNAKSNSITTRDPTSGQSSPPSFEGVDEYSPKSIENLVELMKKLDLHYRETEKFDFQVDKDDKIWISKFEVINKPSGFESELRFIVNYVKDGILPKEDAIKKINLDEISQGTKEFISDEDMKEALAVNKEADKTENDGENNGEIEEEEEVKDDQPEEAPPAESEAEGEKVLVTGLKGAPGFSTGQLVFSADKAAEVRESEQDYIYVAKTCSPEDFSTISQSKGIITYDANQETSYAAAVATYAGVPCVIGCPKKVKIDLEEFELKNGEKSVHEGDQVTLAVKKDDEKAYVFIGSIPIQQPSMNLATLVENPEVQQIIQWGDELRNERRKPVQTEQKDETSNVEETKVQPKSLMIYATTDNPDDATKARSLGAEGVGLCNTDQFLLGERSDMLQKLLIGHDEEEDRDNTRQEIEDQLNGEFANLLETMNGYPVFIRLSDPQIKDYLPDVLELIEDMAVTQFKKEKGEEIEEEEIHEKRVTLETVKSLYDDNPLVGLRGIRLILKIPGLLRVILRAIIENCYSCAEKEMQTDVYISLPFVTCVEEIKEAKKVLDAVVPLIAKEHPLNENDDEENETEPIRPKFSIASMIEVPRAALIADQIATQCEAIVFNLDILAQQACTIDLNEAESSFLPHYALMHVFDIGEDGKESPISNIDENGVGKLLEIGLKKAKEANPNVIVGVAGKQCQTPEAISFLNRIGFDFVSVPADSLPVVRLAAAKATIADDAK